MLYFYITKNVAYFTFLSFSKNFFHFFVFSSNNNKKDICQIFQNLKSHIFNNCNIYANHVKLSKIYFNQMPEKSHLIQEKELKKILRKEEVSDWITQLKGSGKGGDFMFASSNELWRASLDTIDFMPLSSVNYSGGIIITDWYSDGDSLDESIKISIRFLTNEVRTDALDIKVFYKKCNQVASCKISQKTGSLSAELKKQILSKATIYKKQNQDKNFKPYKRA